MQRKKWILDIYGQHAANSVYLLFSLFRMKVVHEECAQRFMMHVREHAHYKVARCSQKLYKGGPL